MPLSVSPQAQLTKMKIGIISDTHIPLTAPQLPHVVLDLFSNVEAILHAGDLVELGVLEELQALAPTYAVYGNMDGGAVRAALPQDRIVELGGFKIGLTHGSGSPRGLAERVRRRFDQVDLIVYGHSHRSESVRIDGTILCNPGSPTDTRFAPYNSIGILHVSDKIEAEIIRL